MDAKNDTKTPHSNDLKRKMRAKERSKWSKWWEKHSKAIYATIDVMVLRGAMGTLRLNMGRRARCAAGPKGHDWGQREPKKKTKCPQKVAKKARRRSKHRRQVRKTIQTRTKVHKNTQGPRMILANTPTYSTLPWVETSAFDRCLSNASVL